MNAPTQFKLPRPKPCRICKTKFQPIRALQLVCGYECSVLYAQKQSGTLERSRLKAERKALRERKLAAKPRSKWLAEVQAIFNRFIRLRDENLPCISCGRFHDGSHDAGHYRTVGACPSLRFHEDNCHRQCVPCNHHKSGNIVEYRLRLLQKIGPERLAWLEGHHEPKHYTIDDLKQLKAYYQLKVKELLKGEQ